MLNIHPQRHIESDPEPQNLRKIEKKENETQLSFLLTFYRVKKM